MLAKPLVDAFWRDGFVVAPNAVTPAQLAALRAEIAGWVEESRAHKAPFGPPTVDGRPRFDMGAEHTAAAPALRRVNNPSDIDLKSSAPATRATNVATSVCDTSCFNRSDELP